MTKLWKIVIGVAGGVLLALVVLALVLGSKGCDAAKDANAANRKVTSLDRRVGSLEGKVDGLESKMDALGKKVDNGFRTISDGLASLRKPAPPSANGGSRAVTPGHTRPRRPAGTLAYTPVAPKPATEPTGTLADHEKRLKELERWRKDRVDPALDKLGDISRKLEALGVKGAK